MFETLHAAGGDVGLRDAGYYAIESLRLEKGYRAWARELYLDAAMALRAAAKTVSTTNPKCFCKSFHGAEAPKECMPTIRPFNPT